MHVTRIRERQLTVSSIMTGRVDSVGDIVSLDLVDASEKRRRTTGSGIILMQLLV